MTPEIKVGETPKIAIADKVVPKRIYCISNGVVTTPVKEKGGVEDIYKGVYYK